MRRDTSIPRDAGTAVDVYVPTATQNVVTRWGRLSYGIRSGGGNAVERYLKGLDELGLDDVAGAREHYERARDLYFEASCPSPAFAIERRREMASALARGERSTPEMHGELDDFRQEQERARDRLAASVLRQAGAEAYTAAVDRIRLACDRIVDDVLRPAADEALRSPHELESERRFETAHAVASIGGLFQSVGASAIERRFRRPDLVHFWQLDQALAGRRAVRLAGSRRRDDGVLELWRRPVDPVRVAWSTTLEHADEWGAGLWGAADVLEHLRAIA